MLVGEAMFRGPAEAFRWLNTSTPAAAVTTALIGSLLFGLQLITSFIGAAATTAAAFLVLSFANRMKVARLGTPSTPTDLLLSQQYLDVSYMMWGPLAYIALATCLGLAVLAIWWIYVQAKRSRRRTSWWLTTARVIVLLALISVVVLPDYSYYTARFRQSPVADALDGWGIHNRNFDALSNVQLNGQLLAFLMNMRPAMIRPPKGYSDETVRAALQQGSGTAVAGAGAPLPDVVIIMSEAFWDPTKLRTVRFEDPLVDAARTTQRGALFSPVFGGYTANTEFEVLSGVSNALLPAGSIPYVQYVTRPTPSLADDFIAAGYSAVALHPFDGKFWNRRRVYGDFGFQTFEDRDAFVHRDMTGPFINDHALAGEINMTLEQGDRPHFIFAVSLQSHAPYTGGMYRYSNRVAVHDDAKALSNDAVDQLSTYASGVRDAVRSFNEVVDHAEKAGRPTIVLMFGDHLPALGEDYAIYVDTGYLRTKNPSHWDASDQERMHVVPLLVWNNTSARIDLSDSPFSPVYLGYRVKKMAGLGSDLVDDLMQRTASSWPILSQIYSKNSSGITVRGMPHSALTDDYALVAYDLLLGKRFSQSETAGAPATTNHPTR
ncbi:LTA synthase family protein [Luteibacter sp. 329MFSha]|uniref:LTA synthase family protein n=1 Tax=Luteibacter sp. 329MFSha TaxID=1798239 RepID=UPI0015875275|nr:LTA synthase family protein [Luteibacter sp. 329MFSha]